MKNIAFLCATALALSSPGIAQAATFSPDGTYVFEGPVEVKKNLAGWTSCDAEAVVVVSGGAAEVTTTLSGAFPCSSITFSVAPFTLDGLGNPVSVLRINNVRTDIPMIPTVPPIPADACEGNILALWSGSAIEFQDPLSDTPDANPDNPGATENPCKIKGVLAQTSGGTLTITP